MSTSQLDDDVRQDVEASLNAYLAQPSSRSAQDALLTRLRLVTLISEANEYLTTFTRSPPNTQKMSILPARGDDGDSFFFMLKHAAQRIARTDNFRKTHPDFPLT
jgi:hypothetical protein